MIEVIRLACCSLIQFGAGLLYAWNLWNRQETQESKRRRMRENLKGKKKFIFFYLVLQKKERKESKKETIFSCLILKSKGKKIICNVPM